ncbi:MAG: aspartate kinase, partial [Anaerolineae bacterium]|nr:aspartate kinase [Anaerolineae bacterium]
MSTLVMKFGGTSVGSAQAIKQAVSIVRDYTAQWDHMVVVVSAMRGVTDALVTGARTAAESDLATYPSIVSDLRVKHTLVIAELMAEGPTRTALLKEIDAYLDEFAALCHSVAVLGEVTPRAMDTISALGERMNVRIVAAAIQQQGTPSQAVDATELVVTDRRFQQATPLMDPTRERVQDVLGPLLVEGVVPVVTGFIGATEDGITTTLGRGGSDYSAAILGVTLDADEVWTWTDVDGVMTTDPRICPAARVIPVLSYNEVGELAYFGAKVLHPKTISPVVERGIPLWVKNTFNPACPGTRIVREPESTAGTVKAVTAIKGLSMVTVEGGGMLGVPGIAGRTFTAVASQGASVLMISQASSEQSICFIIPTADVSPVIRALEDTLALEITRRDIDRVWALNDIVVVTAVGAGMRGTPGVAARIFSALASCSINAIAIAQGSSECSISIAVS